MSFPRQAPGALQHELDGQPVETHLWLPLARDRRQVDERTSGFSSVAISAANPDYCLSAPKKPGSWTVFTQLPSAPQKICVCSVSNSRPLLLRGNHGYTRAAFLLGKLQQRHFGLLLHGSAGDLKEAPKS